MEPLHREIEPVRQVSDIIGSWGRWQTNIALFVITCQTFSAFNGLSSAFYAPSIGYHCSDNSSSSNITFDSKCPVNNTCQKWIYDKSSFHSTIIEEWDLVCDRSWLASLTQSVYMAGIMCSALVFGHLSDKYGRKPMLWIAMVLELVAGLGSAFAPSIVVFSIARFFLSIGCYGRNLTAFLLAIECVGPKYRAILGIAIQLGWATGYIILPAIAYFAADFRTMMIWTTLPEIVWVVWLWYIPESPRWQMTHGRYDEAEEQMRFAVAKNKLKVTNLEDKFFLLRDSIEKERELVGGFENKGFSDLWKTRATRKYSLVLYFTWFVNAFVYYGISLNIGDIGGDLFWNFFFAGLVEFPSYFFCMFIMKYVGRRPLLTAKMYGAGAACLAIIPFVVDKDSFKVYITLFAMIGKFCITSSFGIIYVYSAEIYPTVLRQIGVGSCSVAGRVGSIIAPFIKELNQIASFGTTMAIFGVLSIADGCVTLLLPETLDKEIPDTVEEFEHYEDIPSS